MNPSAMRRYATLKVTVSLFGPIDTEDDDTENIPSDIVVNDPVDERNNHDVPLPPNNYDLPSFHDIVDNNNYLPPSQNVNNYPLAAHNDQYIPSLDEHFLFNSFTYAFSGGQLPMFSANNDLYGTYHNPYIANEHHIMPSHIDDSSSSLHDIDYFSTTPLLIDNHSFIPNDDNEFPITSSLAENIPLASITENEFLSPISNNNASAIPIIKSVQSTPDENLSYHSPGNKTSNGETVFPALQTSYDDFSSDSSMSSDVENDSLKIQIGNHHSDECRYNDVDTSGTDLSPISTEEDHSTSSDYDGDDDDSYPSSEDHENNYNLQPAKRFKLDSNEYDTIRFLCETTVPMNAMDVDQQCDRVSRGWLRNVKEQVSNEILDDELDHYNPKMIRHFRENIENFNEFDRKRKNNESARASRTRAKLAIDMLLDEVISKQMQNHELEEQIKTLDLAINGMSQELGLFMSI